jgi:hypothetical protein
MSNLHTWSSLPVWKQRNQEKIEGTYGIEIEVEGVNLPSVSPKTLLKAGWVQKKDGSLRGQENAEYVFEGPASFEESVKRLKFLWNKFQEAGTIFDDSNRTSVHVHVNCQDFYLDRLASFGILWFSVEDILTEFCGDHRVGNLFCLRASDAPAIITHFCEFLQTGPDCFITDNLHYAGFNLEALQKFGSIEIRTLRGTADLSVITFWLKIIDRLYTLSEQWDDPRLLVSQFSALGPQGFFNMIFGDLAPELLRNLPPHCTNQWISDSMYDSIRRVQPVAYCVDWDVYVKLPICEDPFERGAERPRPFFDLKNFKSLTAPASSYTVPEPLDLYDLEEPNNYDDDEEVL